MKTPSHYDMKIQPVDFILENDLGFCESNAIKYLCRWRKKNGVEDLKKAVHYIEILIEREESYDSIFSNIDDPCDDIYGYGDYSLNSGDIVSGLDIQAAMPYDVSNGSDHITFNL